MSEKHMEDLRRICLICGCHTSQIINVFEPRNGPNIVELIRAKFKFQPVNDDKYLCYTCNNWLINWHSLRNINKDSVDDNSENSRCRINGSMPEESDHIPNLTNTNRNHENEAPHHSHLQHSKKRNGSYFPKRPSLTSLRIGKLKGKYQSCSQCGRTLRKRPNRMSYMQKPIRNTMRCKYCPRANKDSEKSKVSVWRRSWGPSSSTKSTYPMDRSCDLGSWSRSHLPVVDSKLVAKLKRLGTTLVWETEAESEKQSTTYESRISTSRMKSDTRGGVNERNEVLIDFNQALSEVFPLGQRKENRQDIRDPVNSNREVNTKRHELLLSKLPEGITISLVSYERHVN